MSTHVYRREGGEKKVWNEEPIFTSFCFLKFNKKSCRFLILFSKYYALFLNNNKGSSRAAFSSGNFERWQTTVISTALKHCCELKKIQGIQKYSAKNQEKLEKIAGWFTVGWHKEIQKSWIWSLTILNQAFGP